MCPFDLPLHREENHLNKQAIVWGYCINTDSSPLLLPLAPKDLFRITQTGITSRLPSEGNVHIFHSANSAAFLLCRKDKHNAQLIITTVCLTT